jgi:hypothetical protein
MSEDQDKKRDLMISELHVMASEIVANSSASTSQGIRNKMASVASGGYDYADTLHNIYLDFGYPANLEFSNYWNMYSRFGIAKSACNLPVNYGWSSPPIIEGDEKILKEIEQLNDNCKLYKRLRGLDRRQRVGRFAGLFVRVRDDQPLKTPIDKLSGPGSIVELMPLFEGQLEITKTDDDPTSDTFGNPLEVEYRQGGVGTRNTEVRTSQTVHASRIIFISENSDNGFIYGTSTLEPIYNSLMDLRKVIGGGAEGFYKNAAQSMIFEMEDPSKAANIESLIAEFTKSYDDFSRDRYRRSMFAPGMKANPISTNLSNPKEFFTNALNDVAAGCDPMIPATILVGQQTGRLASSEDARQFLSGVQARRVDFQTEILESVFDWFMKYGVITKGSYQVTWDDLLARSETEKLGASEKLSKINEQQYKSGGEVPFSADEIRVAAGFEPSEELPPPSEEIDDEDDDGQE